MAFQGNSLLSLTIGQMAVTMLPTVIVTGFAFLGLIVAGVSGKATSDHSRLQVSLLITTVFGLLGSLINSYSMFQLVSIWVMQRLKDEALPNTADSVDKVLKKYRLQYFFNVGMILSLWSFGFCLWAIMEAILVGHVGVPGWGVAFVTIGGVTFLAVAGHYVCVAVRTA